MSNRYVTVDAEVCIADVIAQLTDMDLENAGLCKITSDPSELRAALYQAAESGDCAAMFSAVEAMAWSLDGRILVVRIAA